MRDLNNLIIRALKKVLGGYNLNEKLYPSFYLEHPVDQSHGDYSCNIAMSLFKEINQDILKVKSPRDFATLIKEGLDKDKELKKVVEKIEIAGPGFINFSLRQNYYLEELKTIVDKKGEYGNGEMLNSSFNFLF